MIPGNMHFMERNVKLRQNDTFCTENIFIFTIYDIFKPGENSKTWPKVTKSSKIRQKQKTLMPAFA